MSEDVTEVKRVKNAVLYSDGSIYLLNARASYPHLTKPYKGEDGDGEGRYGIVALAPKDTHRDAAILIRDQIRGVLKENKIGELPAANKFLRDGNQRPDKPEMKGCYTVSAGEKNPPILRDRGRDPRTGAAKRLEGAEADKILYPGCWVNVLIKPWFQNNKFGKKVNANLLAVQFVKDDEPFGTGRIGDDRVDAVMTPIDDDDDGYDDGIDDDEL